jgi:hypothetical protein
VGKLIKAPDGAVYYVSSAGTRQSVPNDIIVNCIKVRAGAGDPIEISASDLNSYPASSRPAHCPYETEVGLNFVTEEGSNGWIWLVVSDGAKRHAGSLCGGESAYTPQSPKYFRVHTVPTGETEGHVIGADWFADENTCAALPR